MPRNLAPSPQPRSPRSRWRTSFSGMAAASIKSVNRFHRDGNAASLAAPTPSTARQRSVAEDERWAVGSRCPTSHESSGGPFGSPLASSARKPGLLPAGPASTSIPMGTDSPESTAVCRPRCASDHAARVGIELRDDEPFSRSSSTHHRTGRHDTTSRHPVGQQPIVPLKIPNRSKVKYPYVPVQRTRIVS